MKPILLTISLFYAFNSFSANKVIYGKDNRVDVSDSPDFWKIRAQAAAGMIKKSKLQKVDKEFVSKRSLTLGERFSLCPEEKFFKQPVLTDCSGFLVADDIIATAGHCMLQMPFPYWGNPEKVCSDFAWAFDFEGKNIDKGMTSLSKVYNCKEIVIAEYQGQTDFALIKLDKKVSGIKPLELDYNVSKEMGLTIIGHPSGLPKKVSIGGKIIDDGQATSKFLATLDSFQGNSGSAVFNNSGKVVGILVSGKTDYTYDIANQCQRVNICNEDASSCTDSRDFAKAEGVTKIKVIKDKF